MAKEQASFTVSCVCLCVCVRARARALTLPDLDRTTTVDVGICFQKPNRGYICCSTHQQGLSGLHRTQAPGWQTKALKDGTLCLVTAELGGRLLKKNKGKWNKNYIRSVGRREQKPQWANAPSWHLLFDSKRWLLSRFFLLLWYQLPLGPICNCWLPTEQDKISVNGECASPWNNRDLFISPTRDTLVLLFPACTFN